MLKKPQSFDFFAAVRLLERHYAQSNPPREAVGEDADPAKEVARFKSLPSLSFATADVSDWKDAKRGDDPGEMLVTFLGLFGPNGALPQHYTSLMLSRLRERDTALRDFLDLFNHRVISLFYRAWEKNHLPALYERHAHTHLSPINKERRGRESDDPATLALSSMIGLGTGYQQGRTRVPDSAFLFYAGQFSGHAKPAHELERVLRDHFGVPITVDSFHGRWLALDAAEQSMLNGNPATTPPGGSLGKDVIIGSRVWDVQGSFRLRVGPLEFDDFQRFLPSGDRLVELCQMTRSFVGLEFAFITQVILSKEAVPECRLASDTQNGPRLGWNTWVRSKPFEQDADESVFELEHI